MDVYPDGPYGLDALQIINNMTFMGFRDGGDPFTELSLIDYYDSDGAKEIKALFITFGWNGCGASLSEAGRMNTWETQYRSQGLRQLSALHGDLYVQDRVARESTARDWIKKYGMTYDVVIDPTYQLHNGVKPTSDPWGWLVDTKTMKITTVYPGAPGSLWGLTALLK
jgi:hypothetical protein